MKKIALGLLVAAALCGAELDEELGGFEDDLAGFESEVEAIIPTQVEREPEPSLLDDFSGYVAYMQNYSYRDTAQYSGVNMEKLSLFLDYEKRFYKNWKVKINAKGYYDLAYRDAGSYTPQEIDDFRDELRLYDAFVEGSITAKLDAKIGRQVVVWGRSDTIRITDILNPLDNRRFAIVDIEDLRLPTTMAKFDYYLDRWKISPIVILEQQFSLQAPYGSVFNPAPFDIADAKYHDASYALSVGAEFKSWDVNFYGAYVRDDSGYVKAPITPASTLEHPKVWMEGVALNLLHGPWLFKSELAHFSKLKYTPTQDKEFSRTDGLVGFEYNGIAETMISYDFAMRYIHDYDVRLLEDIIPKEQKKYEHALRITSDFMHDTLHLNFLAYLEGEKLDRGGFCRFWSDYDIDDALRFRVGWLDYVGGGSYFERIKNEDMLFGELRYSF